jgi:hypothetical protein
VAVALAVPLKFTVAPAPAVIAPEMLHAIAVAVMLAAVTLVPLIVSGKLGGVNVKPLLLGVMVYEPLANPEKV